MKTIKFRGQNKQTGWFWYGDLIHDADGRTYIGRIDGGELSVEEVDPESVEQFIGYDAGGMELYSGDIFETNPFA